MMTTKFSAPLGEPWIEVNDAFAGDAVLKAAAAGQRKIDPSACARLGF